MEYLNESLELIPHIPLDPNDFRTSKKRAQHKIPRREQLAYWEQSFKEAGIQGIKPLQPNSWLLPVRDISAERILHQILENSWQRIPKDAQTKEALIQSIEGGLSLLHAGKIIYSAQCCSDFGNLNDWQRAAKSRETNWQMLWNGHPWLYSRYENSNIFLSDYAESEPNSLAVAKYAIPAKRFKELVLQAEEDLAQFGERLYTIWRAEKQKK